MKSSAAARQVEQALESGELKEGSPAYQAYSDAFSAHLRSRVAVNQGRDGAASRAALDAKRDMNRAARLVKEQKRAKPALSVQETNARIDHDLREVNPRWSRFDPAYSNNCTSVVQAYELRRRGQEVQAGPVEGDEEKGRSMSSMENTWDTKFTLALSSGDDMGDGGQVEIEKAFAEPGSRGIIAVMWKSGGAHVFNVENVGGTVRFVDGQRTPPRTDASMHFSRSEMTFYMRLDDKPTPPARATAPFLQS
ncbi:toxin glutamine deamidase domain-containing protein [Streptomyces nanshensis]|uniref:toxin glutamine deamidase domain-containing protein n=1 Tax=Streptomyces nanshensis TaxID=518642 RepID=UPI00114D37B8|nr:toxin glutamine deamidase domain-containing protein [Streptomyces nanshensis]